LSTQLRDARQTVKFLERENAELYDKVAELRSTSQKAADVDACRKDLLEAASHISQLQSAISACKKARDKESCQKREAQEEAAQLRQIYNSLRQEMQQLQEKSMT